MMQNLLLAEGDIIKFKSTSLPKGTYVKLRPQSKDFLDISNPKAVLETTLRRYSCLTTGDSILINYNNKRFFIDIFETKPQRAVTIIEARALPCVERGNRPLTQRDFCRQTDCEVDFAPPLDYVEPTPQFPPAAATAAGIAAVPGQAKQGTRRRLSCRCEPAHWRSDAIPSPQHRPHPQRRLLSLSSRRLWAPPNDW